MSLQNRVRVEPRAIQKACQLGVRQRSLAKPLDAHGLFGRLIQIAQAIAKLLLQFRGKMKANDHTALQWIH